MRLSTHIAFGAGIAGFTASMLGCSLACWALAIVDSIAVNIVVDLLGHDHRFLSHARRTRITHSLPGILAVSLLISYASLHGLAWPIDEALSLTVATAASGVSHWILDAMNPHGVYLVGRRFRIARIPYWSFTANLIFQVAGGGLLALSARVYF